MNALFGGTFDPIHQGHVHLIESLIANFSFEEFFVVPAAQNPHKHHSPLASAEQRVEMARLALTGFANVQVLDWETKRSGPSYTVDTISELHEKGMAPLTLIMGNEVYKSFEHWHQPDQIRKKVEILVISRTSERPDNALQGVNFFNFEPEPYSSTSLRTEIAKRWKTKDLTRIPEGLPLPVWEFIKEKRLYAESGS